MKKSITLTLLILSLSLFTQVDSYNQYKTTNNSSSFKGKYGTITVRKKKTIDKSNVFINTKSTILKIDTIQ